MACAPTTSRSRRWPGSFHRWPWCWARWRWWRSSTAGSSTPRCCTCCGTEDPGSRQGQALTLAARIQRCGGKDQTHDRATERIDGDVLQSCTGRPDDGNAMYGADTAQEPGCIHSPEYPVEPEYRKYRRCHV